MLPSPIPVLLRTGLAKMRLNQGRARLHLGIGGLQSVHPSLKPRTELTKLSLKAVHLSLLLVNPSPKALTTRTDDLSVVKELN